MTNDLSTLDVFYGDLTVAQGYVYARLPRLAQDEGLSLAGHVRGPRCLLAETLPVSVPLIDLGPGPTLLVRAAVPDPCFWSPDLPAIYDVVVELRRGSETIATERREIGLRALGVRRSDFILDGKRWVLRGVCKSSTIATLPRQWREVLAAYVTAHPEEDRLAEASQWGALAIVELDCSASEAPQRLRELALYPAVGLVVVRGKVPDEFSIRNVAPNLLLAQPVTSQTDSFQSWAQVLWLEDVEPAFAARLMSQTALPIVAVRRLAEPLPLADARAACDKLQRELAGAGQLAGYVV